MTTLGPAEVLSSSPLAEVYKTEEFKREWANDVRFHVAQNLVHMRRYRKMSQSKLAQAVGTSQSAVARIESGQENITIDTLGRIIGGLDARFHVSIHPPEYKPIHTRPWWEAIGSITESPWNIIGVAGRRGTQTDQVIVGLERFHGLPSANTFTVGASLVLAEGKTSD
jgi:transcriptional regulator with XRE-family HTH domain